MTLVSWGLKQLLGTQKMITMQAFVLNKQENGWAQGGGAKQEQGEWGWVWVLVSPTSFRLPCLSHVKTSK